MSEVASQPGQGGADVLIEEAIPVDNDVRWVKLGRALLLLLRIQLPISGQVRFLGRVQKNLWGVNPPPHNS